MKLGSLDFYTSDKIFLHEDDDKRACFSQVQNFFELIHDRKLKEKELLFHFAHYLNGKTEKNYAAPVSR